VVGLVDILITIRSKITFKPASMKRVIIVFLLLLCIVSAYSQSSESVIKTRDSEDYHLPGDFCLSAAPNVLFNTPNGTQFAGGIKMRVFAGKRLSFETDIVFSKNYCHFGMGLIGIPVAVLSMVAINQDNAPFSALLGVVGGIAASLEHTAYHIPISTQTDISPYISLLRFKMAYPYGNYEQTGLKTEQFCLAGGIELNRYYNRFMLSPYCEVNRGYTDHKLGVNAGVYLGYYFLTGSKKGY
jgi:hypothetical protein